MSKRAIFLGGKRGTVAAAAAHASGTFTTTWQVSVGSDDGWASDSNSGSVFFSSASGDAIGGFHVTASGTIAVGSYAFFRFQSVGIPRDATIDTAKLTLRTATTASGGAEYGDLDAHTFKVDALDVDDSTPPTANGDVNNTADSTEAVVDWSLTSSVGDDANLDTPEIKTVLQEIVDRGGWVSGNSVTFRYYNEATHTGGIMTPDGYLFVQTFEREESYAAKLVVTYTVD